jgi:hypothetical protein
MKALDETGSTGTCELISLKESFQTYINSKGGESKLQGEKLCRFREQKSQAFPRRVHMLRQF